MGSYPDTVLDKNINTELSDGLIQLLSASYRVYLQTRMCCSKVPRVQFQEFHAMCEKHCIEVSAAVDEIAEYIRTSKGFNTPLYKMIPTQENIIQPDSEISSSEMVAILMTCHERVLEAAAKVLQLANKANDTTDGSLATRRILIHEQTVRMLKAATQA